jgi:hypothetical protein
MGWKWQEELKAIVKAAVERKLNDLGLERQWESSASVKGLVYTDSIRRGEVLLCRRELDACKKSGLSFEQAREELIEKLSERLLKFLLEIKRMEMERLLPYTIISVSDLTDDLSTAHYVYLSGNPSDREPLVSSIREELRKLSRKYPEQLLDGGHVILPREYDMTFIVGFINHFYGREN